MSAIAYTDELLKNLEAILSGAIEGSKARYENLITGLNNSLQVVLANRAELMPQADPELAEEEPVKAEPEISQVQPASAIPQES